MATQTCKHENDKKINCAYPRFGKLEFCFCHENNFDQLAELCRTAAEKLLTNCRKNCPQRKTCTHRPTSGQQPNYCGQMTALFGQAAADFESSIPKSDTPINLYIRHRIVGMAAKLVQLNNCWGEIKKKGYLFNEAVPPKTDEKTQRPKYKINPLFAVVLRLEESLRRDGQDLQLALAPRGKEDKGDGESSGFRSLGECVATMMKDKTVQEALNLALEDDEE